MAWIPPYNTQFVEPLVNNLLTYLKANAKDALEWANGGAGDEYQGFDAKAVYNSTIALGQKTFPDLFVWKVSSPMLDDSGHEISQLHHIVFCFELVGADPTELTIRQWRYMRALDSMARAIPNEVLYAGMAGAKHGAIEVINHDYGMPRKFEKELWLRAGMLTVAIAMQEGRNNSYA